MSVTFKSGSSVTSGGSAVTTLSCSAPSGLAQYDLMLAYVMWESTYVSPSVPSGWTQVAVTGYQTGGMTGGVGGVLALSRTAGASEPASYSFGLTSSDTMAVIIVDYGPAVVDGTAPTSANNSASSFPLPTITTTQANETVVLFTGARAAMSTVGTSRETANVSTITFNDVSDIAGPSTPGSFSPGTSTASTTNWGGISIALKPSYSTPSAPTLTSPAAASYLDATAAISLQGTYNSTDGFSQNAYACEIKTSGAGSYSYFNAGTNALQASIVWNTDSAAPGATFTASLPSGLLANGNQYNWSLASQESGQNLQGAFASPFTFTGQTPPSVTALGPTGTVTGTTQPTVTWSRVTPAGAVQIQYQVIIESGSFGTTPGSGTSVWNSGVIGSSLSSAVVGVALTPGTQYRSFVQIAETGGQLSGWSYTTFTLQADLPAAPLIVATAINNATYNGIPEIQVTVYGQDNFLSQADSTFEVGGFSNPGTWQAQTNCGIGVSSAEALDGSYSLAMTAVASGSMTARTGTYSVTPGQEINVFGAFRAATAARTCQIGVQWIGASGSVLSSGTADSTTAWTQGALPSGPPAGLLVQATAPAGATGWQVVATVQGCAASEIHYIDCIEVNPYVPPFVLDGGSAFSSGPAVVDGGTSSGGGIGVIDGGSASSAGLLWTIGGFVGSTVAVVTRSDGVYVRNASPANPATIPATTQVVVLDDLEVVQGVTYDYSAVVTAGVGSNAVSSPATVSGGVNALDSQGWWEVDPTNPTSATDATVTDWHPVNTEQSTAHMVLNQQVMNLVASALMNQDFSVTFELFDNATYASLQALLTSQKTIYVSSPWGVTDTGWFRFGPASGGLSMGAGTQTKNTALKPSAGAAGWRTVQVTAIAQSRPSV